VKIDGLDPNEAVLIIDGQIRVDIESSGIVIKRTEHDAKFLHLKTDIGNFIDKKLERRASHKVVSTSLEGLPPSAKLVFKVLEYEGPLTTREILSKTQLPPRTVRYALNNLIKKGLVIKRFYDRDARLSVYSINI
jgi:DNA-binding MarR family transcriptional regulator